MGEEEEAGEYGEAEWVDGEQGEGEEDVSDAERVKELEVAIVMAIRVLDSWTLKGPLTPTEVSMRLSRDLQGLLKK